MQGISFGRLGTVASNAFAAAIIVATALPLTVAAGSNGQVISFSVSQNTFTYLKVEGTNQNGEWKTWEKSYSYGQLFADTITGSTKWWWKGTLVITFDITNQGRRTCVIDYLRESTQDIVPVIYTEGSGCSGDSGSAASVGYFKMLSTYMTNEDSYKILKAGKLAYDIPKCMSGIAAGMAGGGPGIVVWQCKGIALTTVNEVLSRYGKYLKFY